MGKQSTTSFLLCTILLAPAPLMALNLDSAKTNLGRMLYFDTNLSFNRNQSCGSCHAPPGFVDPANVADPQNSVVSLGSFPDLNGGRNTPSAAYAAYSPIFQWNAAQQSYIGGQFWDGRAPTLTEQAKGPFLNPVEMAMPDARAVIERLSDGAGEHQVYYQHTFQQVYGIDLSDLAALDDPAYVDRVYTALADAIARFESSNSLLRFSSKYDHWLAGSAQFSAAEMQGYQLFNGKAQCSVCHTSTVVNHADGSIQPPLFSNFGYANIGIPHSENPLIASQPIDYGLGGREDIAAVDANGEQLGKFRVMSLRNIAITPPYGHNGYFASLEQIVHFFNTRDSGEWPAPEVTRNLNTQHMGNLGLSAQEEAALVAFLNTLTDGYGPTPNNIAIPALPPATP